MGFFDAIKRWRLTREGLSSGRKRRVHSENRVIQILEDSLWVKLALYAGFALGCGLLILKSSTGTLFAEDSFKGALCGLIIGATAVAMFQISFQSTCRRNSRVMLVLGGVICHLLLVRAVMGLTDSGALSNSFRLFAVPFAFAPMLLGVLLGRAVAAFSAVFVMVIGCLLVPQPEVFSYTLLSLVCGITSMVLAFQVRKRIELLQAGIYVGLVTIIIGFVLGRLDIGAVFGPDSMDHLQLLGSGCATALGTAVISALLISGLLPLFEGTFQLTTDISWLELSDLNHKLLRQMQLEAPGTFHHSLIVAALSEAAAEKIGANAPMCRVCSYFHDVGKLKKPAYFIENQHEIAENPHNSLTPTMSALVIVAHVKDGVDLAVKYKLNPRIIDVIQEHHGDSLVYYFYRRAQEQKKAEMEKISRRLENPEDLPVVDEKNFRYPGPRPSSRESGIIALADTIESASRSLQKPTPAKIRAMVDDLVRTKINDGQLNDCPLTLRELSLVKDSFAATLRSMLHSRIDYPKDDGSNPGKRPSAETSHGDRVIPMAKRA
ncbi:MAG: HDIG domain-containing protein [Akkermansiaceae bacterium]|nr:HDIG domain-containing protein [Akkermansiaceae bacterium]